MYKLVIAALSATLIGLVGYAFINPSGPDAIRPSNIKDPILKPVIQTFADAVDAKPNAPKPRMELGMTYEGAGMNELAEQTYQQYVELFPDRIIGWYRLAIVQNNQGKVEKAMHSLANGVEVAPEQMDAPHWQLALWYIDNGKLELAKEQISIAELKRPNSIQTQIAKGRIALEEGNPELAIQILNHNWLIEAVSDGYVYQLLGRAYRATGDEEKSRETWSRAGLKKPIWADPWTKVVVNHVVGLNVMRQEIMKQLRANNLSEARRLIDEYLSYENDNRVVRRLDASCDAKQGKVGQALQKYAELIKEEPNDTVSMVLLAKLRMRVTQFQTQEEVEITKEILMAVLEIAPDHQQAKSLLGVLSKE